MARISDAEVRERVRERYAAAATDSGKCGCGPDDCCQDFRTADSAGNDVFGPKLYAGVESDIVESGILSLGCGVPTNLADLSPGEVVVDLGSGAGADVLISARRVGPTGTVIGVDMTDEMLELARRNAAEAGVTNVRFVKGYIEELPLASGSVDVVISNCVINLAADKKIVLEEAARVLRHGVRLAISDVIADENMDAATRADMQQWTGCTSGALTRHQLGALLEAAGFDNIEITETHRVHEHAAAAVIRAQRKSSLELPRNTVANEGATAMKLIQVFDPALCCSSGICGIDADQALINFAADAEWASQRGARIERFNLAQEPTAFADNVMVRGFLERSGADALPLVLVDGEVALAGRYPSRSDLTRWVGIAEIASAAVPAGANDGCCGGSGCCS
jgi:2-polyprenyl-3-methyl-5-hydroxy-6-metoxy-1,4-benzoquinol methylase